MDNKNSIRKDNFGNVISKGNNKNTKICFADELINNSNNQKFISTIEIISYKKYNKSDDSMIFKNLEAFEKEKNNSSSCFLY